MPAITVIDCSPHALALGHIGITSSIIFSCLGSAYGTAKAGIGLSMSCVKNTAIVMKALIPIIMAGILGIYGLIMMADVNSYSLAAGYTHMNAGLVCGLSSLVAGIAIGKISDQGIRTIAKKPQLFTIMVLILIFAEALALFGLISAFSISLKKTDNACKPWI